MAVFLMLGLDNSQEKSPGSENLTLSECDRLACSVLRGGALFPHLHLATDDDEIIERLRYHGVTALLHEHVTKSDWPAGLQDRLQYEALAHTMWELRHQNLLAELLQTLAERNVYPILFKGTALAYSVYGNPATRMRGDTDLLINPSSRDVADAVLSELGFEVDCAEEIDFIRFQASHIWHGDGNAAHAVDLHWGISNSYVLSRLFTYDELRAHAVPLPKLSEHALSAGPVHALLIACMHRARHKQSAYNVDGQAYYSGDRLIWLYDIHLLAGSLSKSQWQDFVRLAQEKTLSSVCLEGLDRARTCFSTVVPPGVLDELASHNTSQWASQYLNATRITQHWMDLRAVQGTPDRLRFLGELILPPKDYMRSMSAGAGSQPLAWLYTRRIINRLFRRRSAP